MSDLAQLLNDGHHSYYPTSKCEIYDKVPWYPSRGHITLNQFIIQNSADNGQYLAHGA